MNKAEKAGRVLVTLAVVGIASLLAGAYLYLRCVEFNEFDPLNTLATILLFFGSPILFFIAVGAAIEASASACLRGKDVRAFAAWSALILWIVAVFTLAVWAP